MMWRLLRLVSKRVTVSRDEPIICAISSCVKALSIRISGDPFAVVLTPHSSSSFANLTLEVLEKVMLADYHSECRKVRQSFLIRLSVQSRSFPPM